jgi:WD40 repeat protein
MNIPPPREVLNPATAKVEREFKHPRPLLGCRFDPSGRFLFVTAEDDSIQRYDLLTGTKTAFAGHESWARGMAFVATQAIPPANFGAWPKQQAAMQSVTGFGVNAVSAPKPSPFVLVSADYHGKLIWWQGDSDTPKPLRTVAAHDGWARAVAVSPDGSIIASCGNDNAVKLWNATNGTAIRTLEGHASHVYNIVFRPDGTRLVSCDLKGNVKDWNVKTGKCERDFDAKILYKYDPSFMADIGGARGIAFKQDGSAFAICGITNVSNAFAGVGNPMVVLFDWQDGKPKLLKPKETFQGTAWGVGFHPSGAIISAGGGGQGRVWFWKKDDPTGVHTVNVPTNCRDFAISPTGDRFAVAGANGTAIVYNFTGTPTAAPVTPPKK